MTSYTQRFGKGTLAANRSLNDLNNIIAMPSARCVVIGCNNFSDKEKGISLHLSPKNKGDSDKWKRFVRTKRLNENFKPTGRFVVCSAHFENDCFTRSVHIPGMERHLRPRSIPTIFNKESEKTSNRERRMVSILT